MDNTLQTDLAACVEALERVAAWRCTGDEMRCADGNGCECEMNSRGRPWAEIQSAEFVRTHAPAIAELQARCEALQALCACAYQMAGYHDAPVEWLDALGDAANGAPLAKWRVQGDVIDALLPYTGAAIDASREVGNG